ncbi:hypothetical protein GHT06_018021 [Daphnia sinensis]|uniref:Uncharacterized protein n=1 Tax=Daphnia sinensis TaxID=1820382 RepID=A0AAD5L3S8_9CRUS|nr:hypothetical protein GHT06_018021 [Daphnia sinensis]
MSSETVISEHAHQLLLPCWQWALVSLTICTTCLVFSRQRKDQVNRTKESKKGNPSRTQSNRYSCLFPVVLSVTLSLLMSIYLHRSPFNRWLLPVSRTSFYSDK